MMKLNKNSISNNSSERPDKGILASGSDLYAQPYGKYYIQDLSTMINNPPVGEMNGTAIFMVDEVDDNGIIEKNLQLWNDLGGYATSRTQDDIQVTGWNVFSTDGGGGTPGETIEGVQFIASSSSIVSIGSDSNSPSFLTGLSISRGGDNFTVNPSTGAFQNRTGRNISSMTGTLNFQPIKTGGGVTDLLFYSESSVDGITWTPNLNSLRTMEIPNNGETFKTASSFILDWDNNDWARFRFFTAGFGGINFEPPSTTAEGNTIDGFSVLLHLDESIGGGGGEPQIGEGIQFAGDIADIPYAGEWHNNQTTKVFDMATYPELVALNPDSAIGADSLNLISYTPGANVFDCYPANIKYWNDQLYYTGDLFNGSSTGLIYIRNSIQAIDTSRSYSGQFLSGGNAVFWNTPGVIADDGNGSTTISNAKVYLSRFEVKNITLSDGTICDGFVSVAGSRSADSPFSVHVQRTDLFQNDLSDWVNHTSDEKKSCQFNNLHAVMNNLTIGAIVFLEDGFYLISESLPLKKYSYDFSGGTLKEIVFSGSHNLSINNNSDKTRSTQIGNLTENIYQIDSSNGNLLINNSIVNTLVYNDDLSFASVGIGYIGFVVHEYMDKIYISAHYNNTNTTKALQAWAYFDGTNWNNFTVPEPSNLLSTSSRSIIMNKVDLSTGLLIASLQNEQANGDYNDNVNTDVNFIVSTDYGQTWFDDSGITNNGSSTPSTNLMPIGNIEYTMMAGLGPSTFTFNSLYAESNIMAKTEMFEEGNSEFYVSTLNGSYKLEWIYDAPLNTCTYNGYIPLSNKNNDYTRVK